jgi:hypothetical protein
MKRLKITYRGKEIISDIFNFKAFRVMTGHLTGELSQEKLDSAAMLGVIAMFDGTELTEDVLLKEWNNLDLDALTDALNKVSNWYTSVKLPDKKQAIGETPDNPVIQLYHSLVDHHLPSEIDKQDPQLLIDVMHAKKSDTTSVDDIPESVKGYYGL